jgi:hypothetical protein
VRFWGASKALYEWDWIEANREFRLALALNPIHTGARSSYGSYAFAYLLPMGRGEDAVDQLREAVKLDPLSLAAHQMLAFAFYAWRR